MKRVSRSREGKGCFHTHNTHTHISLILSLSHAHTHTHTHTLILSFSLTHTSSLSHTHTQVLDIGSKVVTKSPPPPFTTSTLQQEASRRLGFGVQRTMQAAQQLYEGAGTGEGVGACVCVYVCVSCGHTHHHHLPFFPLTLSSHLPSTSPLCTPPGEGLITYMRTDGLQMSPEAVAGLRKVAERMFGPESIPDKPR